MLQKCLVAFQPKPVSVRSLLLDAQTAIGSARMNTDGSWRLEWRSQLLMRSLSNDIHWDAALCSRQLPQIRNQIFFPLVIRWGRSGAYVRVRMPFWNAQWREWTDLFEPRVKCDILSWAKRPKYPETLFCCTSMFPQTLSKVVNLEDRQSFGTEVCFCLGQGMGELQVQNIFLLTFFSASKRENFFHSSRRKWRETKGNRGRDWTYDTLDWKRHLTAEKWVLLISLQIRCPFIESKHGWLDVKHCRQINTGRDVGEKASAPGEGASK